MILGYYQHVKIQPFSQMLYYLKCDNFSMLELFTFKEVLIYVYAAS